MRKTLRIYFQDGVMAYDEMPRDQFLFAFPAQVALCGTQIWWTTEVNMAFERLEEGYENALKDYNKKQVSNVEYRSLCGASYFSEPNRNCETCKTVARLLGGYGPQKQLPSRSGYSSFTKTTKSSTL